MIASFTSVFGENGVNIMNMSNKSRGEVAVTMLDIETAANDTIVNALNAIDGVYRVRVVKG